MKRILIAIALLATACRSGRAQAAPTPQAEPSPQADSRSTELLNTPTDERLSCSTYQPPVSPQVAAGTVRLEIEVLAANRPPRTVTIELDDRKRLIGAAVMSTRREGSGALPTMRSVAAAFTDTSANGLLVVVEPTDASATELSSTARKTSRRKLTTGELDRFRELVRWFLTRECTPAA